MATAIPRAQITIKDQLDIAPLKIAQTVEEACTIVTNLTEAMIRRNHSYYFIELQHLDEAIKNPVIASNKNNPKIIEAFTLNKQAHSKLPSEIDVYPGQLGKWEYINQKA